MSTASKENRTLGQTLIVLRNTGCIPKSRILRWNTLHFANHSSASGFSNINRASKQSQCTVGTQGFAETSPPSHKHSHTTLLSAWSTHSESLQRWIRGILAQVLSTVRKHFSHHILANTLPLPLGRPSQVLADSQYFKHFYEGGITSWAQRGFRKLYMKAESKLIL